MAQERANYRSYLLRIWRDSAHGPWRASLETPDRSETLAFPDLETLFAYVRTQTDHIEFVQQGDRPSPRFDVGDDID